MRSVIKWGAVVCLSAVVVGCIWLSVQMAASANKGVRTDFENFQELEVYVKNAEVEIKPGKQFQVVYDMPKEEIPEVVYSNGKLTISSNTQEGEVSDVYQKQGLVKQASKEREITIYVPKQSILTHCKVMVEHGDIEMKEVWINKAEAYCGHGEIDLDIKGNLEEYALDLLVESGEIEVNNKNIQEYRYQKNQGKAKEVYARTNYGDIDVEIR